MTTEPGAPAVGGRYRLEDPIASGGMGDVWRAADELLGRQVAVKILKPGFGDDASFRLRFRAEARASASLSHPGVATVYDYGEQVAGGIHTAYLVMELVPGEPLSALLARQVTIDPARTMDMVAQTADALQAAHDRGIVHRDIKPANLLVRPDGSIKITDFGIARAADAMALTQTGMLLGTVAYMSPEQLSGLTATPASDLYSLGVVAYLCLAGRTPFAGVEQMAVAVAHVRDDVPLLPNEIPQTVRDVVYQLLDKDPARRPGSAGELAATAVGIRGRLVGEPVPTVPTVPPSPLAPTTDQLGRLPTVEAVGATKAATAVGHPPLGVGGPAGNGATVALPDHARPDDARPPLPEPPRSTGAPSPAPPAGSDRRAGRDSPSGPCPRVVGLERDIDGHRPRGAAPAGVRRGVGHHQGRTASLHPPGRQERTDRTGCHPDSRAEGSGERRVDGDPGCLERLPRPLPDRTDRPAVPAGGHVHHRSRPPSVTAGDGVEVTGRYRPRRHTHRAGQGGRHHHGLGGYRPATHHNGAHEEGDSSDPPNHGAKRSDHEGQPGSGWEPW
jgi:eukaryotic-like serine/threonine-protein kinase